jgi:hypothetical protein
MLLEPSHCRSESQGRLELFTFLDEPSAYASIYDNALTYGRPPKHRSITDSIKSMRKRARTNGNGGQSIVSDRPHRPTAEPSQ